MGLVSISGVSPVNRGNLIPIIANLAFHRQSYVGAPFINRLKSADLISDTTVNPVHSDGMPDIAGGGAFELEFDVGLGTGTGLIVATWTGTATVSFTGMTGSIDSSVAGRLEFDITAEADTPRVVHVTGTSCTGLKVFYKADEDDMIAGNIVKQSFKDDLVGVAILRFMDWQITNNSPLMEFAEFELPHPEFGEKYGQYDWYIWHHAVPLQAIFEFINEVGIDGWICIPHQSSDDCITQIAQLADSVLDFSDGKKLWLSMGNEDFNGSVFFRDNQQWYAQGQAVHHDVVLNPATAEVNEVGHNLNTGDLIRFFGSVNHTILPYCYGGWGAAIVEDANNWRVACSGWDVDPRSPVVSVSATNPAVVTVTGHPFSNSDVVSFFGNVTAVDYTISSVTTDTFTIPIDGTGFDPDYAMVDAIVLGAEVPDAGVTTLRYKRELDDNQTRQVNHVDRMIEMWDIVDPIIGAANMMRVIDGKWNTGVETGLQYADGRLTEIAPYFATAPYNGPARTEIKADINVTDQEIYDAGVAAFSTFQAQFDYHANIVGADKMIMYEGGQSNGNWGSDSGAVITRGREWYQGQKCKDFVTYTVSFLEGIGFKAYAQYNWHSNINGATTVPNTGEIKFYGLKAYPGDRFSGSYEGIVRALGAHPPR